MTELAVFGGKQLVVLALIMPLLGALLAFTIGGRTARWIALLTALVELVVVVSLAWIVVDQQIVVEYQLGGWEPPLGVRLRADGATVLVLLTATVVMTATMISAHADWQPLPDQHETRAGLVFWTLLPALWAAFNAVLLSQDLFNLFVALEILTFCAVPLVCLNGKAETFAAALRYLLFALLGSVLYLLGAGLIYGLWGTLDIGLLALEISKLNRYPPALSLALGLMTAGLMAKTAIVPLHLWLPPAHAGAPAPVSAILSAVVVKAAFVVLLRLWFELMPGSADTMVAQTQGVLGGLAIVLGGVLALRQSRLKPMIAYSTIAQMGYLFLVFPLAGAASAWGAGLLHLCSHALAKAALFLAAGQIITHFGDDRIDHLAGLGHVMPLTLLAFGVAGFSLMGLPPTGGFVAKWWLLQAAIETGHWGWAVPILFGGLLTAGYVFRVLAVALRPAATPALAASAVPHTANAMILLLALSSLLLGLAALGTGLPPQ